MLKIVLNAGWVSALMFVAGLAFATPIDFVPPNDTTGVILSTNANDGWGDRRGIGFTVDASQTLSSVGGYFDLTDIALNYGVYEISSSHDVFARTRLLASGGSTISTGGLQWVDYGFNDLTLSAGKSYLIEFWFSGLANQAFYFNNQNVPWSQGDYTSIDGTSGDAFYNAVVANFRINAIEPRGDVPEPASLVLVGVGLLALTLRRGVRRVAIFHTIFA